jgi:cytochrome c-type biogenesis protein CcmH
MLFWVIAFGLTLGASLVVLLPLTGSARPSTAGGAHDFEVYRDQLAEVERDVARGVIQPAEAEQARAEIGRRIIRLGGMEKADAAPAASSTGRARFISAAAVLAVPLISWGLYSDLGSPDLPSQPLAARMTKNPADSTIDELVARAEKHLASDPGDGRGWDTLAPVYMRMQRVSDAVAAYRNAIRLEGSTAIRQVGLGEALAEAAGGVVSADAQAAFEAARKLEPANAKANFYLAVALAQDGRKDEAKSAWQAMLTQLPPGSPWRDAVTEALSEIGKDKVAKAQQPGPTEQDVAAASSMSAEDRTAMIETMVAGLDDKLRENPKDAEGWMRLMRSYVVLGKVAQAKDALQRGVAAFGGDSDEAKKLVAFAASLGVSATE